LTYGYLDLKYFQSRRAIAKVGNVNLTIGEWQARVRLERSRLINQLQIYQQYQMYGLDLSSQIQQITGELNSSTTLGQTVLDQMVDQELIRQEAAKRGITASPEEVDQAIRASYEFFPNGTPTPTITPTEVAFPTLSLETLKLVTITPTPTLVLTPTPSATATPDPLASPTATPTPTTTATPGPTATITPTATPYTQQLFDDNYKQGVDSLAKLGLTEEQIRQLYSNNILREKLFDAITANVPRVQEEVWARHILVKDEATAKTVEDRLAKGEDFANVAKEVSIDTGSAQLGGDLGWQTRDYFVKEFSDAVFSLKVGEISQPVKSQFGYHVIQVLAHEQIPLDASAYQQARQTAFNDWLKQARDEYKVATYDIWQTIVPTDPAVPVQPF
jgi:parvulin-like peptidyl-prolyl isomerase